MLLSTQGVAVSEKLAPSHQVSRWAARTAGTVPASTGPGARGRRSGPAEMCRPAGRPSRLARGTSRLKTKAGPPQMWRRSPHPRPPSRMQERRSIFERHPRFILSIFRCFDARADSCPIHLVDALAVLRAAHRAEHQHAPPPGRGNGERSTAARADAKCPGSVAACMRL